MAAPRAKSLLERHGFKDTDLNTAKHDDLVIWLYENIGKVLSSRWSEFEGEWGQKDLHKIREYKKDIKKKRVHYRAEALEELEEREKTFKKEAERAAPYLGGEEAHWPARLLRDYAEAKRSLEWTKRTVAAVEGWDDIPIPACKKAQITDKVLEKPISDRNYIIGYIDLVVETAFPVVQFIDNWNGRKGPAITCETAPVTFYFEVKTKIDNVGALLRQINAYRKYEGRNSPWVVFCPQVVHREVFREQGVVLITPDEVQKEPKGSC